MSPLPPGQFNDSDIQTNIQQSYFYSSFCHDMIISEKIYFHIEKDLYWCICDGQLSLLYQTKTCFHWMKPNVMSTVYELLSGQQWDCLEELVNATIMPLSGSRNGCEHRKRISKDQHREILWVYVCCGGRRVKSNVFLQNFPVNLISLCIVLQNKTPCLCTYLEQYGQYRQLRRLSPNSNSHAQLAFKNTICIYS